MKSTGRALLCQPFRAVPNAIFSSLHFSISPLNRWQTGSFEGAVTTARSLPGPQRYLDSLRLVLFQGEGSLSAQVRLWELQPWGLG